MKHQYFKGLTEESEKNSAKSVFNRRAPSHLTGATVKLKKRLSDIGHQSSSVERATSK